MADDAPVYDDSLEFWCEDDGKDDAVDHSSVLDREWNWRHEQFRTAGYREGITAGKEASAQAGFNVVFKQSIHEGYNWGLVRGITCAFANLSDQLKEKLAGRLESKDRFLKLSKSVQSISTTDALKMYRNNILHTEATQYHSERKSQSEDSSCSQLDSLCSELISLLHDSQEVNITMNPGQEMLR